MWIDYWWYLRHNPFATIGTHPGDWEGMTVGVSKRTSRITTVGFASHDGTWRYGQGVTQFSGERPHAFIANNSHAAYPKACSGERVEVTGRPPFPSGLARCRQDDGSADGRGERTARAGLRREGVVGAQPQRRVLRRRVLPRGDPSQKVYVAERRRSEAHGPEGRWSAWKAIWGHREKGLLGIGSPPTPGNQGRLRRPDETRFSQRVNFGPRQVSAMAASSRARRRAGWTRTS